MLRRGLKTIDELKEVEKGEEEEQKRKATLAAGVAFIEAWEPPTFSGDADLDAPLLPSTA